MNGSAVFIIAFFTSAVTAVGSVYLAERLNVFEQPAAAQPASATVPSLTGLALPEAEAAAKALGFELFLASTEEDSASKPNVVLRQAFAPGRELLVGSSISIVVSAALTETPDVGGQEQAAAEAKLKAAGFKVEVGEPQPHAELPVGRVASQNPEAGAKAAQGSTVTLRISSGPADVEVPKVAGFSLSLAKQKLNKAGLKHLVRWVDLAETATYVVLRQEPAAGKRLKPGGAVTLIVNRE